MAATASSKSPAESPGFALWHASNVWQRTVRDALEPFDLTHGQFVLLSAVAWLEPAGAVKQEDAGEVAGMDAATASQVARKLEGKGLVQRGRFPGDARARQLASTGAGRRRLARATPAAAAAGAAFFAPLGSKTKATVQALRTLAAET